MNTGMHFLLASTLLGSDSSSLESTTSINLQVMKFGALPQQRTRIEQSRFDYNTTTTEIEHHLKPLWKCTDPNNDDMIISKGRPSKVIFVHVFKTAGMSIRELLLRYALACHAGIGMVSECSGLSPDSLLLSSTNSNEKWMNGFGSKEGKPCYVKAINRTKADISLPHLRMQSSQLAHLDLLAGHLSLGAGAAFSNSSDTVQYITFFRNAVDKFISGIMYQKKDQNYSFEQIIELVHKRVRGELKQNKYREGYSAYLLTPQQKQNYYGRSTTTTTTTTTTSSAQNKDNNTIESRVYQILENLQQENIVFGIVERMSDSLELIQYVLDAEKQQTELFESFGMTRITGGDGNGNLSATPIASPAKKVNNPSKYSTASVVEELKKDPKFLAQLDEYVKYDQMIYLQALNLHNQQYRELQQQERIRRGMTSNNYYT